MGKKFATIYYDGRIIELHAMSMNKIGSQYLFYNELNATGKIIGMFPIDSTGIVINK